MFLVSIDNGKSMIIVSIVIRKIIAIIYDPRYYRLRKNRSSAVLSWIIDQDRWY